MTAPADAAVSPTIDIKLSQLLIALSYALDMAEGQAPGHAVRSCRIGMAIGRELALPHPQQRDLFYTLLLKDAGSTANASELASIYMTDDIAFKRDARLMGGSRSDAVAFRISHTGSGSPMPERLLALGRQIKDGNRIANELTRTRAGNGAQIARRLNFSDAVADGIKNIDEHWNGGGRPSRKRNTEIPLLSRIALVAQIAEAHFSKSGPDAAEEEIAGRSGTWFDPEIVASFQHVMQRKGFWRDLGMKNIDRIVEDLEPIDLIEPLDDAHLDEICAAFADIIDSKSPYMNGHSARSALFSDLMAENLGFSYDRRRWFRRAALLHDIGKIGVGNLILDRCGKLDRDEWAIMKQHTVLSETVLSQIPGFAELAVMAGNHHERIDGKGYPHGLSGDEIALDTRILTTADIFDALTAKRPYRDAMTVTQALDTMRQSVGTAIDNACFTALRRVLRRMENTSPLAKVA